RAVDGRGAVREYLDALQRAGRDDVGVGLRVLRSAAGQTQAIHDHQRRVARAAAEAMDLGRVVGVDVLALRGRVGRRDRGHRVHQFGHGDSAGRLDLLLTDRDDVRANGRYTANAGAGHHDLFELGVRALVGARAGWAVAAGANRSR